MSTEGPLDQTAEEGQSIEERAENNGHVPDEPVFALDGDRQLTLGGLGATRASRGVPIEAEVSIMSASVPCRGLIDPDKQGQLLISYVPAGYRYVPVRDGDKITKWKLRQYVRPSYVEAIEEGQIQPAPEPDAEPAE